MCVYLVSIALSTSIHAQNYEWAAKFGDSGDDAGGSIAVDSLGNMYGSGRYVGQMIFGPDTLYNPLINFPTLFFCKLSSTGVPLWATEPEHGTVYDILTKDGNVFFGGETFYSNPFLEKYDTNGTLVWSNEQSLDGVVFSIAADQEDNTYSVGFYTGFSSTKNGFIIKYDSMGNETWNYKLGNGLNEIWTLGVGIDTDSNILVAGVFRYYLTVEDSFGTTPITLNAGGGINDWDVFLVKYSPDGQLLGAFQHAFNPFTYSGYYWGPNCTFDNSGHLYLYLYADSFTVYKYSSTLNLRWNKSYKSSVNDFSVRVDLSCSADDTYLGISDGYAHLIDSAGQLLQSHDYLGGDCITIFDCARDGIAVDNAGSLYLNSTFSQSIEFGDTTLVSNLNSLDVYFAKLLKDELTEISEDPLSFPITIFPNPSDGTFFIYTDQEIQHLKIINAVGRTIFEQDQRQINDAQPYHLQHNGIYFIEIRSEGRIFTKKLFVIKE